MSRLAATLCWGAHRDTAAIRAIGAKVWSLGTCPNGPLELRSRPDDALSRARFGAATVSSGDVVFADDDGVVFVGLTHLAEVIDTARAIAVREGAQATRLLKGELLRSQLDLHGYLAKRAANPAYTFRDHLKTFGGAIEI